MQLVKPLVYFAKGFFGSSYFVEISEGSLEAHFLFFKFGKISYWFTRFCSTVTADFGWEEGRFFS